MTPEIMRALVAKGFTSEQIADIEEILGAKAAAKAADRRAKNAERMRNVRARAQHGQAQGDTLRTTAHADERAVLFAEGQMILARFGIPKERSGPMIGGWLKRSDAATVLKAIEQARDFAVSNPTAYIATILNNRQSNGRAKQSLSELAHDLAEEVRERERENDLGRTDSDERSRRNRF